MTITLVGGGPDSTRSPEVVEPFVRACHDRGARRVALLLAGDRDSADHYAADYVSLLSDTADAVEVLPLSDGVTAEQIDRYDAFVVGGGPTPVYHRALATVAAPMRRRVRSGAPYLGFSAGAMVASGASILGGHRSSGADVCPVEWSEGLEEVDVRPGLGLVPWAVETHAAQAGTLGRAVDVVGRALASSAVAIDEDTALVVRGMDRPVEVVGSGAVWWVTPVADTTSPATDSLTVRVHHARHPAAEAGGVDPPGLRASI
ncbi:Type 1 glutamine amidotransferase-like domain-containing protein [Isoptericola sediminis]|uniref:Type 1 glutamine amidotransferase-like domain-containing protein n=1 Tax=Isoptericola sediminis TaxID=2733572 RepID=A0A849JUY8_9MICO|nr:Type 1 glutamine amidotransferase-like domain-containing protein [Isoptericola sediminis]NNU27122.1 type 1 glutamine amidotransferase-like domain-containing protein [Isoptericola sediminis]